LKSFDFFFIEKRFSAIICFLLCFQELTAAAFDYSFVRDYVFKKARAQVMGMTKGLYPAPLKIIEVIKNGLEHGLEKGYEGEARGFSELAMTSESNALISLFQGQTQCKKNRFGAPKQEVKQIGILGAGLMGAGIVQVSIDKGYKVILKDMSENGLTRGFNQISKGLDGAVKRKRISR
jgi:enoyl-CoA hydratase/long-chain 3-hydroxyacyl-CoA dehydrogenase